MNKFIVVSDNHGHIEELENIYNYFKNESKAFLHCGDSEFNNDHPIFDIYQTVKGNCDNRTHEREIIVNVDKHKVLVVHGHKHHVKFNLKRLYRHALETGADIVCFGHTHYPFLQHYENITFINPGSVFSNRGVRGKSFAVVEFNDNRLNVKHLDALTFKEYKW